MATPQSAFGIADSNPRSRSSYGSFTRTSPLKLNTNLSDSDDNLPTPKGTSPPPNETIPGPSNPRRSLRFSALSSSRPNMSHLLEKQPPAPAELHGGDRQVVESPVEERRDRDREEEQEDSNASGNERSPRDSSSQRRRRPWPLEFKPVLVLENSGSVARDHLASERTFLAYVRTSLAIASTGVALVQLFTISVNTGSSSAFHFTPASKRVQAWARPLGVTTVCLGIAVLLIGVTRYFTVQQALTKGKFPVARFLVGAIALVLALVIIIVFGVLVAGGGPRGR